MKISRIEERIKKIETDIDVANKALGAAFDDLIIAKDAHQKTKEAVGDLHRVRSKLLTDLLAHPDWGQQPKKPIPGRRTRNVPFGGRKKMIYKQNLARLNGNVNNTISADDNSADNIIADVLAVERDNPNKPT